ncbi:OmpA domain protein [Leucobacter sp. 7(1)]|uniref:choice-of-anchor Q domain-containing protein n=1 Tax=Leucobacter sp. 7(1) TaxID=1255613 RepID=UPI00097E9E42|nr:choice-of-anchor Q domain-containing protein [Leucobacter sp. 7(1)]SJN10747.1 OmpA domain protein [Leucobacter sp. 7(1)]
MLGAAPAIAEDGESVPDSTAAPEISQLETSNDATEQPLNDPGQAAARDSEACTGITFPLVVDPVSGAQSYTVTNPGNGTEEGTLRWAFAEANAHPGIDEIVVSAGLVVEIDGEIEVGDGLVLRGDGAGAEIRNIAESGDLISSTRWLDFPISIENLTFTGGGGGGNGLYLARSVCALGLDNVTVQGFASYGIVVGDTWPFELLDVRSSVFRDNGHGDDYEEGALVVSNEGIDGSVHIRDSVFADNQTVGLFVEADIESSPERRGEVLIERTSFLNNHSAEREAGAIEFSGFHLWDEEEDPEGVPVEGPMLMIRDSLFRGNTGYQVGAVSTGELSGEIETDVAPTLAAIERTTFDGNRQNGSDDWWGSPANDLWIEWSELTSLTPGKALTVSDSTFSADPEAELPAVAWGYFGGASVFTHVTMTGGGMFYAEVEGDAALDLRNSVIDTGARDPIVQAAEAGKRNGAAVLSESNMAYTTAPALVPAGEGRIIGTTADFALGALDDSLGLTPVRVPGEDSLLIDAAGPGGAAADQRAAARPQGAGPDIGAVEVIEVVPPVELVDAVVAVGADQSSAAGKPLVFEVSRTNAAEDPWTGEASVRVRTADGTAQAGTDYTAVDTVVTWAADDVAPKQVSVPTDPGHVGEGEAQLTVSLSEPGSMSRWASE